MVYPTLTEKLKQNDKTLQETMSTMGSSGCGESSYTPYSHQELPLACWQNFGGGGDPLRPLKIIQTIAALQGAESMQEAQDRCDRAGSGMASICQSLYSAVDVPIMH